MNGQQQIATEDVLQQLADSVADYCARGLVIDRLRKLRHDQQSYDADSWRAMTELGWAAVALTESDGGWELGAAGVARVSRQLGRVVAPEPFIETAVAAASLLAIANPNDDRLAQLVEGAVVYTVAMGKAAWRGAHVSARADGDSYIIDGELSPVALLEQSDRVLIAASLGDQIAWFDLAVDAIADFSRQAELADGSQAGVIIFKQFRVFSDACVMQVANDSPAIDLAFARVGIAASAYLIGLAEALLEMTLEYVRTRKQFGQAIGSFQALQHRLVDLYAHQRLSDAALGVAIEAHDSGASVAAAAARARHRACAMASATAREAIQMHGAIGYTAECDVALYVWRSLVITARYGGGLDELKAMGAWSTQTSGDNESEEASSSIAQPPKDSDWNALDDSDFRRCVRSWLGDNYPEELRHLPYQLRWSEIKAWHMKLLERGWVAPAWPREHGGMGLNPAKLIIFIEELERHGVARAPDQGIVMVGPILFRYGTDAQREKYLQSALSGEHIWCQGYSEPNAGSDLATLATRAELDGDEFVVSGQKTWTTHALDATHMYCLVRTDFDSKPQAGISFLLIDLDQDGIERRPIPNLGGHVDFCEVFLDNVRVPHENLVGELNQGWTIAKALLGHERLFVGSPKLCQHALNQLRELALKTGLDNDPVFGDALARITLDVLDLEALYAQFAALAKAGIDFGADVALLKIWSTETYAQLSEMIIKASGEHAAIVGGIEATGVDALGHYYNARPAPIYAGSNEIQRNILAKHVLQLPTR